MSRHDTFRTVRCPLCEWESPRIQDPLEAKRRNDAEDVARRNKRREDCEAQFRARGYGTQAAEAMASKKLREQPLPPPRNWTADDIGRERAKAESQRKIAAGEVKRCPAVQELCTRQRGHHLGHVSHEVRHSEEERDIIYCVGEGMPADKGPS